MPFYSKGKGISDLQCFHGRITVLYPAPKKEKRVICSITLWSGFKRQSGELNISSLVNLQSSLKSLIVFVLDFSDLVIPERSRKYPNQVLIQSWFMSLSPFRQINTWVMMSKTKSLFSSPLVNYVDILCFPNDFSEESTLQNLSQLSSLILTDQRAESKTVCIGSCWDNI